MSQLKTQNSPGHPQAGTPPQAWVSPTNSVEILAPTGLEYWAVRCMLYRVRRQDYGGVQPRITCTGMGLGRWRGGDEQSIAIVCGLAGALDPGLRPGTVVVPELVSRTDGTETRCDPVLREALVEGARALSFEPESGPLLTAPSLVTGDARHRWAHRGFIAADMETGLLAGRNIRVAAVRVILDSPERSISEQWVNPARALLQPALWGELLWLGRSAPRYALRAARVLKAGLDRLPATEW
jgi:hypothetical protein